jgi:hypothetical protein
VCRFSSDPVLYTVRPPKVAMSAADAEPLVLDLIEATAENFAPYGLLISGSQVSAPGLTIPFYSHVEEGKNLPFEHTGKCVVRTARIHPDPKNEVNWIERHMHLTQVCL